MYDGKFSTNVDFILPIPCPKVKIRLYNPLSDASKLSKSNERTCVHTYSCARTDTGTHARTHAITHTPKAYLGIFAHMQA